MPNMPKPKQIPTSQIEAKDPEHATEKFEEFTRKILSVPKKEIDEKSAQEASEKKNKNQT